MSEKDLGNLKTEISDKWKCLYKKLAYPHEYFNSIDGYLKSVKDLKIDSFVSKLKKKCPSDKKQTEQKKLIKYLILKMEKI